MTSEMLQLLEACVKTRLNIVVAGGTGSGKTTMLNGLSAFISPKERIVTIEDAAELQLKQPHVARLETRPPNIEGGGAIRQRELLMNALRMRPDRIVVGECRGEEALDMLQAMNTGHDGSLTTDSRQLAARRDHAPRSHGDDGELESEPCLDSPADFPPRSMLSYRRRGSATARRRVMSITEVGGLEGDTVTLQDLFVFEKRGLSAEAARCAAASPPRGSGRASTKRWSRWATRCLPDVFDSQCSRWVGE